MIFSINTGSRQPVLTQWTVHSFGGSNHTNTETMMRLVAAVALVCCVVYADNTCTKAGVTDGCNTPFGLPAPYKAEFMDDCHRHDICYACVSGSKIKSEGSYDGSFVWFFHSIHLFNSILVIIETLLHWFNCSVQACSKFLRTDILIVSAGLNF